MNSKLLPTGAASVAAIAGRGGGTQTAPPQSSHGAPVVSAPQTSSPAASVRTNRLGTSLVDAQGRTLYVFENDTGPVSSRSGACAAAWPAAMASANPTAGPGVNQAMLGTTMRMGGGLELTYDGHPLYLYTGDTKAGDAKGQGVTGFGAGWYVVAPSGDKIDSGGS